MSWREHSLKIINDRIRTLTNKLDWEALSHQEKQQRIKNAVDSHYPYSQRSGWAYQSWLDGRADIFAQWGIPTKRVKQRPPANRKGWRKPIVVVPGLRFLLTKQDTLYQHRLYCDATPTTQRGCPALSRKDPGATKSV